MRGGQPAGVDLFFNAHHTVDPHTSFLQSGKCGVHRHHPGRLRSIGQTAQLRDAVLQAGARTHNVGAAGNRLSIQGMNGQVTLQQRGIGLHQGLQMRVLGFEGAVHKSTVQSSLQAVSQAPQVRFDQPQIR